MLLRRTWRWLGVLALACAVAQLAFAEETPKDETEEAGAAEEVQAALTESPPILIAAMPVFVPPNRGSPMARLGGATRSAGAGSLPRIEALVPEESGWTLREEPVLYWYLAETTDTRIEFALRNIDAGEMIAEAALPKPTRAGVQRLALADQGVKLEPGISYQWYIKLVPNPADRSYDRVVGGGIERVEASPELDAKLDAKDASSPHVLAEAGIWYDAVDALSNRLEVAPGNRTLWNQRAALFEQVGLPAIPLPDDAAPGFGRR